MSADANTLTCNSCDAATEDIPAAMQHVAANPEHEMTAAIGDDGTTMTISMVDGDDYDDDDWNAEDQ